MAMGCSYRYSPTNYTSSTHEEAVPCTGLGELLKLYSTCKLTIDVPLLMLDTCFVELAQKHHLIHLERKYTDPKHDIYSTCTQLLYTVCNTIKLRTVSFHIPHIQGADYPGTVRFQPPDYHLGPTHPLLISVLILTHHPQTAHSPRPNIHQRTHEFAFGQAHSVRMGSSSSLILSAVTLTLALISTCSISAWSACPGVQKRKR